MLRNSLVSACDPQFGPKNADFGASRAALCTHKRARIDFFNRLGSSRKLGFRSTVFPETRFTKGFLEAQMA